MDQQEHSLALTPIFTQRVFRGTAQRQTPTSDIPKTEKGIWNFTTEKSLVKFTISVNRISHCARDQPHTVETTTLQLFQD